MVQDNPLFRKTRWQLATSYAGVLSLILGLCALGVYEAIAHAHWMTVDQELKTVAGTIHNSLEPILQSPGNLNPNIKTVLPELCRVGDRCYNGLSLTSHRIKVIQQGKYYIRLFSLSGELLAVAGGPPEVESFQSSLLPTSTWETLKDTEGIRYRQTQLMLHNRHQENWGYLQVGRSLADFDNYVKNVQWLLLLGLPLILLVMLIASWKLSERAMIPLHQSYQQLQQFTTDAAHELRTPLAAAQATLEAQLLSPSPPAQAVIPTFQALQRQHQRLAQIITDLLTLARLEKQISLVKNHSINLQDLITDIQEELMPLALQNQINLQVKFDTLSPLIVQGDESQLYRLLINLVINAIQHTPSQGNVTVQLSQRKNMATIAVADTGEGIADQAIPHIFERFYQADSSRSPHGTGLGLAIALAIAHNHHGRIEVNSQLGVGSQFLIHLPLPR